ncbi:MAG: amidohydrolase family protein [Clostridia bacterium]|nr:amidohydrolase family protein [Clostridia bacterium]
MKNFALRGNICYSAEKNRIETIEGGYAVCVDGICRGIYAALPAEYAALPVHDYGDQLIIPGLVDLHIHAPQYSYRGLGMDLELMDWLQVHAFPEEAKYADLDYARLAYGMFADNMKKSATTRACIFASRHREATELLMDMMEEAGLVSYVGKVNMDSEAPDILREPSAEESAAETEKWICETAGKYENTLPVITPRFIPSCSRELLKKLGEIQARHGTAVQSHLSENLGEIQFVRELFPETEFYGQAYDQYGLFGSNAGKAVKTLMAHCIYSCDAELEMMKKQDVFIVHCPASNMNVCSGIAPMRKYLDMGMKLGVGSDVAGGQTESLFRAITDAIQVSKLYWRLCDQGAKPLTFDEAFYLATKGGGEFFGKVGSFEDGYEFDAVVIDDSSLVHPQPLTIHERLERAVYLAADHNGVRGKFVRGKKVI